MPGHASADGGVNRTHPPSRRSSFITEYRTESNFMVVRMMSGSQVLRTSGGWTPV